jgi:hypothetical protein
MTQSRLKRVRVIPQFQSDNRLVAPRFSKWKRVGPIKSKPGNRSAVE